MILDSRSSVQPTSTRSIETLSFARVVGSIGANLDETHSYVHEAFGFSDADESSEGFGDVSSEGDDFYAEGTVKHTVGMKYV